jgi:hypothetical protein
MAIHTRKVVRNHVKPYTGAAAFATQMRERGWRIIKLERIDPVVRVSYEKELQDGDARMDGER